MRQTADADHPWRASPTQQRHQPGGKSEVTLMVRCELHLGSIHRGLAAGQRHDSRIVDQETKGLSAAHPLREVDDRCEARQIEKTLVANPVTACFAADLIDRRLSLRSSRPVRMTCAPARATASAVS
jgi:hypothetical protein